MAPRSAIKGKQIEADAERKVQEEESREKMEERKAMREEMLRRERDTNNLLEQL